MAKAISGKKVEGLKKVMMESNNNKVRNAISKAINKMSK